MSKLRNPVGAAKLNNANKDLEPYQIRSRDIYFTPYLPMEISANDIIVILLISFLMVFVSINIAARRTLLFSPLNLIKLEK